MLVQFVVVRLTVVAVFFFVSSTIFIFRVDAPSFRYSNYAALSFFSLHFSPSSLSSHSPPCDYSLALLNPPHPNIQLCECERFPIIVLRMRTFSNYCSLNANVFPLLFFEWERFPITVLWMIMFSHYCSLNANVFPLLFFECECFPHIVILRMRTFSHYCSLNYNLSHYCSLNANVFPLLLFECERFPSIEYDFPPATSCSCSRFQATTSGFHSVSNCKETSAISYSRHICRRYSSWCCRGSPSGLTTRRHQLASH